ncbi:hypothetical protein Agub_g11917 [Astrephomene gubernaculifera]|uniref:Uncharacterized protein n=1 Tax=Astrephomene gubernaculifera TaxID=47775 RepID=A0AAD3DYV7_9CHLO|nr:hypothetical protein Agub_g11917 [Astrephomene gubernaculifera]
MRAKVLVVPVYQKHWLYHVWSEHTAAETAAQRSLHWSQGGSLQDKAVLFGKEVSNKISVAAQHQWKSIQAADEGTFKNKLYRLAQWVLSQEDPLETFLKSVPHHASSLEIIHPVTMKERLVRRRLRRLALSQEHYHNRRILGWALATLPQLPLMITPFPNVTLYYTAYKVVSHYQARQGCRTLRAAFERYDAAERERAAVQARAGHGGVLRWLALPRLHGGEQAAAAGGALCGGGGSPGASQGSARSGPSSRAGGRGAVGAAPGSAEWEAEAPLPQFRASKALDQAVRPLERWQSPLTDEMALRVRSLFPPPRPPKKEGKKEGKKDKDKHEEEDADSGGGAEAVPELVTRLRQRVLERRGKKCRSGRC